MVKWLAAAVAAVLVLVGGWFGWQYWTEREIRRQIAEALEAQAAEGLAVGQWAYDARAGRLTLERIAYKGVTAAIATADLSRLDAVQGRATNLRFANLAVDFSDAGQTTRVEIDELTVPAVEAGSGGLAKVSEPVLARTIRTTTGSEQADGSTVCESMTLTAFEGTVPKAFATRNCAVEINHRAAGLASKGTLRSFDGEIDGARAAALVAAGAPVPNGSLIAAVRSIRLADVSQGLPDGGTLELKLMRVSLDPAGAAALAGRTVAEDDLVGVLRAVGEVELQHLSVAAPDGATVTLGRASVAFANTRDIPVDAKLETMTALDLVRLVPRIEVRDVVSRGTPQGGSLGLFSLDLRIDAAGSRLESRTEIEGLGIADLDIVPPEVLAALFPGNPLVDMSSAVTVGAERDAIRIEQAVKVPQSFALAIEAGVERVPVMQAARETTVETYGNAVAAATGDARLTAAVIRLEDQSVLARALAFAAEQQGRPQEAVQQELIAIIRGAGLPPALTEPVAAFALGTKKALTLRAAPKQDMPLAALVFQIGGDPAMALELLDVEAMAE